MIYEAYYYNVHLGKWYTYLISLITNSFAFVNNKNIKYGMSCIPLPGPVGKHKTPG
jgi:hypothetical protein